MDSQSTLPIPGLIFAVLTAVALGIFGLHPVAAVAVLIVWAGTLILATERPPELPNRQKSNGFNPDTMGELIENAQSPLIVTRSNKVTIANRTARKVLGGHIIGQDMRVIFRQPEAVALLNSGRDGRAIIRGLVRRRDIWKLNRQSIGDGMSIIELTNQTAESDISRAHTDFVANASHELRTPLAAIIGYVETLSEDPSSLNEATSRKFLGTIEREAHRMRNLVSDLLSLSRVEAEKHDQPGEAIKLANLVERAANDAAGNERRDRLVFVLDDSVSVLGDTQQLEQLVRNLVDNALKYGANQSAVSVSVEPGAGGNVRLSVQDQGEGISPEHLPHLTRRFYRTDPGRSRASGGTGLGLAIVKHIVERHRGRLDITSEPGKGTNVLVRLPAIEPEDEE